ncbi:MAG TPA: hypothetical protein VH016_13855 [Actinomycetota bacterium]|nr:hypothetical protein [Actinomycetota bacterium]
MRWLRFSRVAGAVLLLGLLGAGPAAAQPDHLHADLSLVACDTLQATGFELPASTRLDVRFENVASGAALHRAAITTSADGTMTLKVKVPLTGVKAVRMELARPGAAKPFVFSEMSIAGNCPLPFTGPARAPALAGLAVSLLVAGAVLVRMSATRGRHRAARP